MRRLDPSLGDMSVEHSVANRLVDIMHTGGDEESYAAGYILSHLEPTIDQSNKQTTFSPQSASDMQLAAFVEVAANSSMFAMNPECWYREHVIGRLKTNTTNLVLLRALKITIQVANTELVDLDESAKERVRAVRHYRQRSEFYSSNQPTHID